MTQYVDKDALAAEIEKRLKFQQTCIKTGNRLIGKAEEEIILEYNQLLSFLDTLEAKEVDLEKDVRQILSLYYEGIKYYEDVIRKEREENGGSDLAIKIMDGVVDARELGIQYVIDKLKAQKVEQRYTPKEGKGISIEREVKIDSGGYPFLDMIELYDYDKDAPLAKEGDKVKVIITRQ